MAIENFQTWLRKNFGAKATDKESKKALYHAYVIQTLVKQQKCRRLLIDLNALVHDAITAASEKVDLATSDSAHIEVADELTDFVVYLIDLVRPSNLCYLAADGVTTKAKMVQQRQRSYAHAFNPNTFNKNNVKPATEFMIAVCNTFFSKLTTIMKERAKLLKSMSEKERQDPSAPFCPDNIEMSDSTQPGEGEHKIIKRMTKIETGNIHGWNRMYDVVYSPDSDMHLLVMMNGNPSSKIIIMRTNPSYDPLVDPDVNLKKGSRVEFFDSIGIMEALQSRGIPKIRDFVLITFFAGNDFLPALPFVHYGSGEIFETLIEVYLETFKKQSSEGSLYVNGKVLWENLFQFLQNLQMRQERFMLKRALEPKNYINLEHNIDRSFSGFELSIMNKPGEESGMRFAMPFFEYKYNKLVGEENVKEMCNSYLQGIVWIMAYYANSGSKVNLYWAYCFNYAPNLSDLTEYVFENHYDAKSWWEEEPLRYDDVNAHFPAMIQLLTVFRKEDMKMLPAVVRTLFLKHMPSLYPDQVQIDMRMVNFTPPTAEDSGPKWFERGIAIIDFPNIKQIEFLHDSISSDPHVQAFNSISKIKHWGKK